MNEEHRAGGPPSLDARPPEPPPLVPPPEDVKRYRFDDQGRWVPTYSLYDSKAVGWATFAGSMLAGGVVMAINYGRLGDRRARRNAVLWSATGLVVLLAISLFLPDSAWINGLLVVGQVGIMVTFTDTRQGSAIAEHRRRGGRFSSKWRAAGIGLLVGIAVLVVVAGGALAYSWGEELLAQESVYELNAGDEVIYAGDATLEDARFVGDRLTYLRYLDKEDYPASVRLFGEDDRYTVSFYVADDAWEDPENEDFYRALGEDLADQRFGRPLTVHLCDVWSETQKVLQVE